MTREEAIRLLDPETTAKAIAEIQYYAGFIGKGVNKQAVTEACELAVKDMRKQTPMKPKRSSREIRYCEVWTCPSCGFTWSTRIVNFCYRCGQAKDWEGIE